MKLNITAITPTPEQLRKWHEVRAVLLYSAPGFAQVFINMLDRGPDGHLCVFTSDIPTAATDGSAIIINPDFMFNPDGGMGTPQGLFVVAHEIMHAILNHCNMLHGWLRSGEVATQTGKTLPFIKDLMNIAMDLVINDILVESRIGTMPDGGLHDHKFSRDNDGRQLSTIEVYEKLFKNMGGGKPKKGEEGGERGKVSVPGLNGEQFDDHLEPGTYEGKDPMTAAAERNEGEWRAEVKSAMETAKLQGKLPAALERMLGEITEPRVDWKDHIRSVFARMFGYDRYAWSKPDRHLLTIDAYAPSPRGSRADCVVVAIDTSGSVYDGKYIEAFLSEVSGILAAVRPRETYLMWCDASIGRVDYIDQPDQLEDVRKQRAPGGGGTSFVPVFDRITEMGISPEAVVYLTDLYGDAPHSAPPYPVVWGTITKDYKPFSYGEYVYIDLTK